MKKIAVIAAMDKETALLQNLSLPNLIVEKSGIGKVSATVKTMEIINHFHPDLIINSGIAGGLEKTLKIGDMICATHCAYHDVWCGEPNVWGQVQDFPLYFKADNFINELLPADIKKGLIVSGDQFITDINALEQIKAKFPEALAVDMESAAIAQTCYITHTPFISLRLISDTPGVKHHQEQYENFWQSAAETSFNYLRRIIERITVTDEG